ncbi:PEGA domain-containing protein [Sorangium sp. So ce1099]|uniref:PEGA domain-containing protein n=1 Tax=Sorangium sp. So ce1099 TaxID=3133331 RepID=UPI003F60BB30
MIGRRGELVRSLRSFRSRTLAGWILALGLLDFGARAAPAAPPGKASPGTAPQAAVSSEEAEARAQFEAGVARFDKQEYREALEAFRRSLWLKKNRNTMGYIASCLKQLGQYEDALEQYEEMRREFPQMPSKIEAMVAADMAELSGLVGTLAVTGDAPVGASLFVDDRLRGRLPLEKPLRLSAGRRAVRVEKEGFAPLTMTLEVRAGQENVAELVAKSRKGRLVVNEKHNWVLHVELDGKNVGVTPWQGLVDLGEHKVRLRGFMGVEALAACEAPGAAAEEGAKVASGVEAASVRLYEETRVVLVAEEQDASLRVESTPEGAVLMIDEGQVGLTPWEGRLPLGEHMIEVSAVGFFSAKQTVQLERRKQRELSVLLERQSGPLSDAHAARNRKIGAGLAYGVGVAGLGVFAVAGGLALDKVAWLNAHCPDKQCPSTETRNQNAAATLGTAATVGLVVGGLGLAAGTAVLLLTRPGRGERRAGPSVSASVGLGGFEVEGRF